MKFSLRIDHFKKYVIGFGFVNGIWTAIGISPGEKVLEWIQPIIALLPTWLKIVFAILPLLFMIITIITLIRIYKRGRIRGAIAVALAYIAGTVILIHAILAGILLLISIILGIKAFRR